MAAKQSQPSTGQVELLEVLYKYRFSSRQLIAESLGIKAGSSLHERLAVVLKHEYVGMRLDKHLKLLGMPAAYHLTPKGLRALQATPNHEFITHTSIKSSYKDKSVGQSFINHTMNVHKYTNRLKQHYPDLKVFTKREMNRYSYFPSQLPDAFLSLSTNESQQPKRLFLDLIPETLPSYQLDRRISSYSAYFDEGGWDVSGSELPTLLFLGERAATERRIRRITNSVFRRTDAEELTVLTTTMPALHNSNEPVIWSGIEDPDELRSILA